MDLVAAYPLQILHLGLVGGPLAVGVGVVAVAVSGVGILL